MEIKADEFIIALSNGFYELEHYLDLETGEVVMVMEEGGDEQEETNRLVKKKPKRFVQITPVDSHESFGFMEDFVANEAARHAQERLSEALRRRKPFREFKDALFDFPEVREAWFRYEQQRYREVAEEWLRDEGIEATLV